LVRRPVKFASQFYQRGLDIEFLRLAREFQALFRLRAIFHRCGHASSPFFYRLVEEASNSAGFRSRALARFCLRPRLGMERLDAMLQPSLETRARWHDIGQQRTLRRFPEEHRRICPLPSPEPTPEHLHDETLAWHDLEQHVPASAMDWARREWGLSLKHGIPPAYAHANILKQLPHHIFREVKRCCPGFTREAFDAYVAAGVPLEQILQDVQRAFATAKATRRRHRHQSMLPPPRRRVRQADCRAATRGCRPIRIFSQPRIRPSPSASREEPNPLIHFDGPAEPEQLRARPSRHVSCAAHAQKANGGANSSAPSLATRIRSWFN
jgi:hypothetical protein